jgi:hypothetical protein
MGRYDRHLPDKRDSHENKVKLENIRLIIARHLFTGASNDGIGKKGRKEL